MNLSNFSKLTTQLETMDGFPSWSDRMSESYYANLSDIPDAVAQQMIPLVRKQFGPRPDVKTLREWATTLSGRKTFEIPPPKTDSGKQITHRPGSPQLESAGACLPHGFAKRLVDHLRKAEAEKPPEERSEYGLQFEIRDGFLGAGRISRTHPRLVQSQAQAQADERNLKWPHQHTSVFRKDDPLVSALGTASVQREAETRELVAA